MAARVNVTPIRPEDFDPNCLKLANFANVENAVKPCQDAKITYVYKKDDGSEVEGPLEVLFEDFESNYSLSIDQHGKNLSLVANITEKNIDVFGDTDNYLFEKDGFYKILKLTIIDQLMKGRFAYEKKIIDERKYKGKTVMEVYAGEPNRIACGIYIPTEEEKQKKKYYEITRSNKDKNGNICPNVDIPEKMHPAQKAKLFFTNREFFTKFGIATVSAKGEPIAMPIANVKSLTNKNYKKFNIRVHIAGVRYYNGKTLKLKENVKTVLIKDMEEASSNSGANLDGCMGKLDEAEVARLRAQKALIEKMLGADQEEETSFGESTASTKEQFGEEAENDEQEFNSSSLFNNTM